MTKKKKIRLVCKYTYNIEICIGVIVGLLYFQTEEVREKRALVKTASKNYQKNPTIANARILKKRHKINKQAYI